MFGIFGKSVELPVLNGTYAGRIVSIEPADTGANYEVTVHNDAGQIIAATKARATYAVTPDGVVINPELGDPDDCSSAVPWR